MDILSFLLSVADDLNDDEFKDCDEYLDVQNSEPDTDQFLWDYYNGEW